ncbi:hypothetical protein J6V86_01950 [bacterium]|nr:hypothetical protein [bacterium]
MLDFRYNTQEEIDKLNDEMTTTTDLDEMIRQTNNINGLENNKEVENINKEDEEHKEDEDYLRQKDEQDAEFGLEKDLQ